MSTVGTFGPINIITSSNAPYDGQNDTHSSEEPSPNSSSSSLPPVTPDLSLVSGSSLVSLGDGSSSSDSPAIYEKTNVTLPDMIHLDGLKFDSQGGPFPVMSNSDPHNLNAFLLHPGDGLWEYMQPMPKATAKSPLGRPPLAANPNRLSDIGSIKEQPTERDGDKKKATRSKLGFRLSMKPNKTDVSSRHEPETKNASQNQRGVLSQSNPFEPASSKPALPLSRQGVVEPSEAALPSTSTSDERPANKSRWSWLMRSKSSRQVLSGLKTPISEEEPPDKKMEFSADILAGVPPSSIPIDTTQTVTESLKLRGPQTRAVPESVRALRTLSAGKLAALRLPSPNPLSPETPATRLSGLCDTQRVMRFPKSTNPFQKPGSGLSPTEGGMRIDVGVRLVLSRIEMQETYSAEQLDEISKMATIQSSPTKRLPNGLSSLAIRHKRLAQAAANGPGIPVFLDRPPFEDRIVSYDEHGTPSPITSETAVYDVEFSLNLIQLGQRAVQLAKEVSGAKRPSLDPSSDAPFASGSSEMALRETRVQESVQGSKDQMSGFSPGRAKSASSGTTLAAQQSPSRPTPGAPAPIANSSSMRKVQTQKKAPVKWGYDTDTSESESSEESEDEEEPLSNVLKRQATPSPKRIQQERERSHQALTGAAAARAHVLPRPKSFVALRPPAAADSRPAMGSRTRTLSRPEAQRNSESEAAALQYREHVMQARERREQARSGQIERQRQAERMMNQANTRRDSTAQLSKNTTTATSTSQPATFTRNSRPVAASSRVHARTKSDSSSGAATQSLDATSLQLPHGSKPSANFSRRSNSHADVRQSTLTHSGPSMVPMPTMPRSMSFTPGQPAVMYMPVPVMPYPPVQMGYMPMQPMPPMYGAPMPQRPQRSFSRNDTSVGQERSRRISTVSSPPTALEPSRNPHGDGSDRQQQQHRQRLTRRIPVQ